MKNSTNQEIPLWSPAGVALAVRLKDWTTPVTWEQFLHLLGNRLMEVQQESVRRGRDPIEDLENEAMDAMGVVHKPRDSGRAMIQSPEFQDLLSRHGVTPERFPMMPAGMEPEENLIVDVREWMDDLVIPIQD